MRQLWTAAVLLTALVTGLLLLGRGVDRLVSPMLDALPRAAEAAQAGDWETVEALTLQAAEAWEAAVGRLHLAEDHQIVGEITALLDEAAVNARVRDLGPYRAAVQRTIRSLTALRASEQLTLGNLF